MLIRENLIFSKNSQDEYYFINRKTGAKYTVEAPSFCPCPDSITEKNEKRLGDVGRTLLEDKIDISDLLKKKPSEEEETEFREWLLKFVGTEEFFELRKRYDHLKSLDCMGIQTIDTDVQKKEECI